MPKGEIDYYWQKLSVVPVGGVANNGGLVSVYGINNPASSLNSITSATGSAVVMELFEVDIVPGTIWWASTSPGAAIDAWTLDTTQLFPNGTGSKTAPDILMSSTCLAATAQAYAPVSTGSGHGDFVVLDRVMSLEDNSGRGVLVAAPYLYLHHILDGTGGAPSAQRVRIDIWYRLVSINLQEYLGILQSQAKTPTFS